MFKSRGDGQLYSLSMLSMTCCPDLKHLGLLEDIVPVPAPDREE